eukprot:5301823-Heterocapsa_arctica.AAC.1
MKLANRCPEFAEVFRADCRRRFEEGGYIPPEAQASDAAAPARSPTPSAVAQDAQIPPSFLEA